MPFVKFIFDADSFSLANWKRISCNFLSIYKKKHLVSINVIQISNVKTQCFLFKRKNHRSNNILKTRKINTRTLRQLGIKYQMHNNTRNTQIKCFPAHEVKTTCRFHSPARALTSHKWNRLTDRAKIKLETVILLTARTI